LMFTPCFQNCFYKNAKASCAATRPSSVGTTHTSMELLLGFEEATHFVKFFREETQMPPLVFGRPSLGQERNEA
jgi:hypothetical protein